MANAREVKLFTRPILEDSHGHVIALYQPAKNLDCLFQMPKQTNIVSDHQHKQVSKDYPITFEAADYPARALYHGVVAANAPTFRRVADIIRMDGGNDRARVIIVKPARISERNHDVRDSLQKYLAASLPQQIVPIVKIHNTDVEDSRAITKANVLYGSSSAARANFINPDKNPDLRGKDVTVVHLPTHLSTFAMSELARSLYWPEDAVRFITSDQTRGFRHLDVMIQFLANNAKMNPGKFVMASSVQGLLHSMADHMSKLYEDRYGASSDEMLSAFAEADRFVTANPSYGMGGSTLFGQYQPSSYAENWKGIVREFGKYD